MVCQAAETAVHGGLNGQAIGHDDGDAGKAYVQVDEGLVLDFGPAKVECETAKGGFDIGPLEFFSVEGDVLFAEGRFNAADVLAVAVNGGVGAFTGRMAAASPFEQQELQAKADCVLLKLSPMLDWRKAVSDLGQEWVREVHIVSVGNECKELLVVLTGEKVEEDALRVVCVNIAPSKPLLEAPSKPPPVGEAYGAQTFHYGVVWSDGADKKLPLQGEVLALQATKGQAWRGLFLYEPNASIMKAGCFDALSVQYGLSPLSANSHLFISPDSIENFPGRSFQISAVSSINKRELKDALAGIRQANITVRNFPMSVADIRRRLKLADGGDTYIFATTLADGSHVLLICQKVSRTLKKDKASQNNCEL